MEVSVLKEKAKARKLHTDLITTYRVPFEEFFKVSLDDFWLPNDLGFDLLKFEDEVIGEEDGQSMQDIILRDFGHIAMQTILGVLGNVSPGPVAI